MTKLQLVEAVENVLLMVLDEADKVADLDLDSLTKAELDRIGKWAATMMFEASDNPCRARQAPACLRAMLPKEHYLQTWRKPKRKGA